MLASLSAARPPRREAVFFGRKANLTQPSPIGRRDQIAKNGMNRRRKFISSDEMILPAELMSSCLGWQKVDPISRFGSTEGAQYHIIHDVTMGLILM